MPEAPDVSELRELLRTARSRYTTLRAIVRDWGNHRRICEVQGLGWSGTAEEASERLNRVWLSADGRVREEWDTGQVRLIDELDEATNGPLFDPGWLVDDPTLSVIGERKATERSGIAVEALNAAEFLLPGADHCLCVVDPE